MTTLSINFYADNMTDELKNEFTQAIAHESADMNIQLLNDSITKLEKKITNENGNYSAEEVQAFQVQLASAKESRTKFEDSQAQTLEAYNKVVSAMSERNTDHFGNSKDVVRTVLRVEAEGYMSLSNNNNNELVVTIKTGEDTYYKDYIYLNDWTCYVMEASDAYYNTGNPIMSDSQFDQLLDELREWENETGIVLSNSPTQNVGAIILDNIKEVTHTVPMLSLEKCHSVEEIVKFANNHNLVASVKLDGLTVRLTYKDGDLILAESRGNGTVGSDVTEHVKQFTNVPLHINKEGTYVIDGEALIKLDDFAEINKNGEYKNSRNLAAGTLSSLDTSVVKERRLSWYAWKVIEGAEPDVDDNSFYDTLKEATFLGFDVVPHSAAFICIGNMCQKTINTMLKYAHDLYLPQDGVVFRFDDLKYGESLGRTSHHFRGATAWKAPNNSVETTLVDIEWTMGKTGSLCPTAIFKPVKIYDTIVSKASLSNLTILKQTLRKDMFI